MQRSSFLIRPHLKEGTYIDSSLAGDTGFRGLQTDKESGSKGWHFKLLTFGTQHISKVWDLEEWDLSGAHKINLSVTRVVIELGDWQSKGLVAYMMTALSQMTWTDHESSAWLSQECSK